MADPEFDWQLGRPRSYTPRHLSEKILASRGALEGERKQVTVLFCDIVRSSALVDRLGAERFHDLINDFFALALDVIHRFEGTVNQFLGDGFMALFGAPVAHEDHTRRAVLASLELRTAVATALGDRGVELRMGIGSGLVVVGKIGDDLRMDYTAYGDTTVLAARLQAAAAPGEILLTDEAAERMRGYFALSPTGPITAKERTFSAQRVMGVGSRRSRLQDSGKALAPFVGRERELSRLQAAFSRAEQGEGQIVDLVGDPGLGKSRLVIELRASLTVGTMYEGHCMSYGVAIPYLPIVDLVRHSCDIAPDDPRINVGDRLNARLRRCGLDADAAGPFLFHLLGHPGAPEQLRELDPATVKGRIYRILRDLWVAQSRIGPLVLVLEDLHWIDRASEELVAAFVDEINDAPILLLTTHRVGYTPPWSKASRFFQLTLRPLSEQASRTLVSATLTGPADPAVMDAIVSRGEGNPFFLEELTQSAHHDAGDLVRQVPQTVQDVLAARIDRLGDEPKRAVQIAAVLGRAFPLALIAAVWDGQASISVQLRMLQRLRLLSERRQSVGSMFAFKHALTQEVAYASLLEKTRRELHLRAAHALEQLHADHLDEHIELVAHHYARSDDREGAAQYLVLANRKAARRNAMDEAIGYFYQAIKTLESLPDTHSNRRRRLRLVFDQTGEFHFLHRHQEYYDLILQSESVALGLNDRELLGAFYARLGHRQWTSGKITESIPTLKLAVELCDDCGNVDDSAGALAILAWAYLFLGDYERVPFYRDKALAKLTQNFHPVWYSFARGAVVLCYAWSGRWEEAIREAELAIDEGRSRSDSAIVSFNAAWMAAAYMYKHDWARTQEFATASLQEAPTVYFRGFPQAFLARALCETDEVDRGVEILAHIESLLEASGHQPAWGLMALLLGEAYRAVGDRQRASKTLNKVRGAAVSTPLSYFAVRSSRLLGEIALEQGNTSEAETLLRTAIDAARSTASANELGLALGAYGRLQQALGDLAAAREHIGEALEILERLGTLEAPSRLRSELKEVGAAGNRPTEADRGA